MSHLFQTLQAQFDVGKALEMVVLSHKHTFLLNIKTATNSGKRIIQSLARHMFKVFVAFHCRQAEGELQLFLPPDFGGSLRLIGNILSELLPDANRVYQCAVHVESQGLTGCHYYSPYCKPDGRLKQRFL